MGSATDLVCSLVWGTVSVFASVSPIREDCLKVPLDGPTNRQEWSHRACGSAAKSRPNQERRGAGPALRGAEVGCDWPLGLEEGVLGGGGVRGMGPTETRDVERDREIEARRNAQRKTMRLKVFG